MHKQWQEEIKNKVKNALGIPEYKKIILYAPTWREDCSINWLGALDFETVIEAVKNKFSGEWLLALRLHDMSKIELINENPNILVNASYYQDMQELLLAADIMISDYSSAIFDFMFTRRPAFIFANDADAYSQKRSFYYPLQETPFLVAKDNKEMKENIFNFDEQSYSLRIDEFIRDKGIMDDGHASERTADFIDRVMERK
jgi:CDP-glycerol glycerophosphotransferase